MPFGIPGSDEFVPEPDHDHRTFVEIDVSVGELIWVGPHRLRVLDIDGREVVIRVDSADDDDGLLPEETRWSDLPR